MKALDTVSGTFKKVYVKALDSLPVGSEIDYSGSAGNIPVGWEQVTDPNSYSTTEVKTEKTWTTGKPIYRKVIDFTLSNTTGAFQNIAHGIQNLGSYRRIVYFAYMHGGTPTYPVPNDAITEIGFTDSYITYYNTNSYITGDYCYAILEYTKTTD